MSERFQTNAYEVIQVPETTRVHFSTEINTGSYFPNHWHDAIEIIYMLEGNLDITVESASYRLYEGHCFLINSSVIHSTKCTTPNTGIVFQIPFDFIRLYIPNVQQLRFELNDPGANPVEQTKIDIFKDTLMQMKIADDIRPEGYILRFNSLLFEILFQLYHHFSVRIFHTNLEYQNEVRLSHIYQDLVTTTDTLSHILERHGFTNYKVFRRMFSEHFHATPSQIRRQLHRTPESEQELTDESLNLRSK